MRFVHSSQERFRGSRHCGSFGVCGVKISEIFYSIQGEGMLTGVPSVFVRTSGCNLRCTWCDTPYTSWIPEGADKTVEQIVAEVRAHPARHVVVTGGEPMIAEHTTDLTEALRRE